MSFPTTNPALARALAARGYTVPTAVQIAVLEADATNRDLLVSAQTGSGKTVAFGLAFGETLLGDAERLPPAGAPMALIVAPTRELAMQVSRELTWLYEATGARVVTCVGGMDARAESRMAEFGGGEGVKRHLHVGAVVGVVTLVKVVEVNFGHGVADVIGLQGKAKTSTLPPCQQRKHQGTCNGCSFHTIGMYQ